MINNILVGWLMDFNSMFTNLGLIYAKRLENNVHLHGSCSIICDCVVI